MLSMVHISRGQVPQWEGRIDRHTESIPWCEAASPLPAAAKPGTQRVMGDQVVRGSIFHRGGTLSEFSESPTLRTCFLCKAGYQLNKKTKKDNTFLPCGMHSAYHCRLSCSRGVPSAIPFTIWIIISSFISFINPCFHQSFCLKRSTHTECQLRILQSKRDVTVATRPASGDPQREVEAGTLWLGGQTFHSLGSS